jgi:hypothetical protein
MSETLALCPFCGGDDSKENATMSAKVHLAEYRSPVGIAWRVECRCGVTGRGFEGRDGFKQASEWWNNRA